ncbi:MAG: SRPBCC domain-containing protein [Conexibacter sp.]
MAGRTAGRPVLVFDGDCAFCTSCARLLARIGPNADVVAWQVAELDELRITAAQAAETVRWVGADGTVRSGHEALAAALGTASGPVWRTLGRALLLPGVSALAAAGYRLVARNRHRLPGGTPACASGPGTAKVAPRTTRTDVASRVIAAAPEKVYGALVDPHALAAWLPPDGMRGRFERFDARPGGSYRLILTYADGSTAPGKATANTDVVEARFLDIDPGARVVQTVDFVSDDPAYAGTMTMTWEVTAVDGGTRIEIRAENVPAGISADDHAAGLASSLENLAAHVGG